MQRFIRKRYLSFFSTPSSSPETQWVRRPEALQELVVCVSPNCESSAAAFRSACEIASNSHANVSALHVPSSLSNKRPDMADANDTVSLQVVSKSSVSSVKKTIVQQLKKRHDVDLCLIGANRTGLFSTVQYVTKNAPCDVLVVRDDNLWSDGPMKAVVCFGINDWEGSIEAFRALLRIAKPGDEIEAVHVVHSWNSCDAVFGPPMMAPQGNGTTEHKISKSLERAMMDALKDKATSLSPDDVNIKPVVLFAGVDNPTKILVDYAASNQVNLVSVGLGSIDRIFAPPNFSYYLTHKSPCSVLVARRTPGGYLQTPVEENTKVPDYYVEDPEEWFMRKSSI